MKEDIDKFIIHWLGKLKFLNAHVNPIIYFSRKTYSENEATSVIIKAGEAKTRESAKTLLQNLVSKSKSHDWYHLNNRYDLVFVMEKVNGKYRGSIQSIG